MYACMQDGRTAIMHAIIKGDGAMVDMLVEKGGDIDAKDNVSE